MGGKAGYADKYVFGGITVGFLFSTASSFSFRMDGLTGLDWFGRVWAGLMGLFSIILSLNI